MIEEKTLDELVEEDSPITYGVVKPGPEDQGGVLFIRGGDVANGEILIHQLRTITKDISSQYRRTLLRGGELVVSLVGNPGQVAIVPDSLKNANIARQVGLVRLKSNVSKEYIKYYLLSRDGQLALGAQSLGSVQQVINLKDLRLVKIPLPPLPEQHAIAGTLGALDDKIELNRRMNRTLESMARAVFRQWFVESDDVDDWQVGTLGDVVVNFDSKRVPLSKREREQRQGKYPYYGAASIMDYVDDYLFDGIYVLMAEDGSVVGDKDHPVLQYVWDKFWINNHAHVLQGTNGICNEHLYLFLKDVNILPYVTGAVQPKLNQANMNSIPFVIPPKELSKKFEEFASPVFAKIRANEEESCTLASLRDNLLPKLMRGEVRVKDVEEML